MAHVTVNWEQFGLYTKPKKVKSAPQPVAVQVLAKLEPRSLIRYKEEEIWVENSKLQHGAFGRAFYLP